MAMRDPMKRTHRRIGRAYRDDAEESHDAAKESPNAPADYRIAMKSLFMRAQQAARDGDERRAAPAAKPRKSARNMADF
jgi:hypothetical protein